MIPRAHIPPERIITAIAIGDWLICRCDDGTFWLTAPTGEGLRTSQEKLESLVQTFFEKEF
jgi:hypothetical protein